MATFQCCCNKASGLLYVKRNFAVHHEHHHKQHPHEHFHVLRFLVELIRPKNTGEFRGVGIAQLGQ